jgi:D-sedoheptulose 7-phosphate isomerase|tara:strand:- start:178 stop:738 length:561 start_codon:yes stop_codon:yes gene_type:complete
MYYFVKLGKYTSSYFAKFSNLLKELDLKKFEKFIKVLIKIKKTGKKVIIVGNGGSAAMASHVSVDLTKQCGIRSVNFNEADLITCFANDYGHDNWMKEAIRKYYDRGDLVIQISSSGNSKNHVVCANFCKKRNINLITFTGFGGYNKLAKIGKVNFWLDSENFNQIEMAHHVWLLLACDFVTSTKF